jgi:hypothetical protein
MLNEKEKTQFICADEFDLNFVHTPRRFCHCKKGKLTAANEKTNDMKGQRREKMGSEENSSPGNIFGCG